MFSLPGSAKASLDAGGAGSATGTSSMMKDVSINTADLAEVEGAGAGAGADVGEPRMLGFIVPGLVRLAACDGSMVMN